MTEKLKELLDAARGYRMSADECLEQKVSFAYGNMSFDDTSTKEEVREAVTTSRHPEKNS